MTSIGVEPRAHPRASELSRPAHELVLGRPDVAVLAMAAHHGTDVRAEVARRLALTPERRRHEEDPYTAAWCRIVPNRLIAHRSRFEVDLNRPPERAVYRSTEDAWGLSVWKGAPPEALVRRSLVEHARFYATLRGAVERLLSRHAHVLVLDLHTYNHRRGGPGAPLDDPSRNPALNVGTGTMDRARWASVVDAFVRGARSAGRDGPLDVRENVRFFGGHLPAWLHRTYPTRVCALALEVKKTFMDEWTGRVDVRRWVGAREVLRAGTASALAALEAG
jgi:N-formylglutamate amidohydrolase